MKTLLLRSAFALGLLSLSLSRAAASTDTLAAISRQLQADSNANFIIVEALHDSLLSFDTGFDFEYRHHVFLLDGKPLPEPYQSRYLALHDRACHPVEKTSWSYRTDGISYATVADPSSSFRRKPFWLKR